VETTPTRSGPGVPPRGAPLWSPYEIRDGKIHTRTCEINVTEHCNLSCRACSHLSPVLPRHAVEPESVARDLSILAAHYHAESIRLVGGEPLLHPELVDLVVAARATGVGGSVCIATNGVLLPRMPPEFWHAVDRVEVSLYPGKELSPDEQQWCREQAAAAGVDLRMGLIRQFRESYSELGTENDDLIRQIYESCVLAHRWRSHTIADGYFYKCPPSYFLPKLMRVDDGRDGLRIEQAAGFRDRLLRYLESTEPLGSCRHCLGSSGKRFSHHQTARADFRVLQRRPTEELLDRRYLVSRPPEWRRMFSPRG
jgi:organic radical activating enzyme